MSIVCEIRFTSKWNDINNNMNESIDDNMKVGFVMRRIIRAFCFYRNSVIERWARSEKDCVGAVCFFFHFEVFITLAFNTVMYETGEPFFKIGNVMFLRDCIRSDFDSCECSWSLLKTVLNMRKDIFDWHLV